MRAANPLEAGAISFVVSIIVVCLSQLVWGDLKLEHFLLFSSPSLNSLLALKAIDFESAVPFGAPLTELYSPQFAPPERATWLSEQKSLGGKTEELIARPSYDSELATSALLAQPRCCLQFGA